MKFKLILALIVSTILLNSCSTFLAGYKQEIQIKSDKPIYLTIDSNYIGEGNEFYPILRKDAKTKQLILKADGYRTEYKILVQDVKSKWIYLSLICGVLPALFDIADHTWNYLESYKFPPLAKYENSDSLSKSLIMNNISFDIKKDGYKIDFYYYDDYIGGSRPYRSKILDSVSIKYSIFSDDLEEILKKTKYTDTLNTVFMDNVNTLTLNASITNLVYNEVHRIYRAEEDKSKATYKFISSKFMDVDLTTLWSLHNIYGDTLSIDTIKTSSGQFSLDFYKVEDADKMSIKDALEKSMWEYIEKQKKTKILKFENKKVEFSNSIKINKSSKTPTNLTEAMNATVTIKNKDGHGSGFLVSNDGYIVTNYHVVAKNQEYTVVANDGKEYKASVIRSNKAIDLAIIKVDGKFDFAFEIPEKQNYKVGDEILAIGTPKSIELGQSVSKGIVSGTRKNKGMNYLQTDIKINQGNSGGPIVLSNGQLTSVVEYKLIGQGVEGLSFSIPAYDIFPNLNLSY